MRRCFNPSEHKFSKDTGSVWPEQFPIVKALVSGRKTARGSDRALQRRNHQRRRASRPDGYRRQRIALRFGTATGRNSNSQHRVKDEGYALPRPHNKGLTGRGRYGSMANEVK